MLLPTFKRYSEVTPASTSNATFDVPGEISNTTAVSLRTIQTEKGKIAPSHVSNGREPIPLVFGAGGTKKKKKEKRASTDKSTYPETPHAPVSCAPSNSNNPPPSFRPYPLQPRQAGPSTDVQTISDRRPLRRPPPHRTRRPHPVARPHQHPRRHCSHSRLRPNSHLAAGSHCARAQQTWHASVARAETSVYSSPNAISDPPCSGRKKKRHQSLIDRDLSSFWTEGVLEATIPSILCVMCSDRQLDWLP
jgi:hypothetical protein